MEELKGILFRLLKDELDSLAIGHTYNYNRISRMKEICHLLTYEKYVDFDEHILNMIRYYEY